MINLIQKIMESSHNKQNTTYTRQAYHAGSWYESNPAELNGTLSEYLAAAKADKDNSQSSSPRAPAAPRAVIAPHAGFSYSGPVAGYAYQALAEALQRHRDNAKTQTVTMTIIVLHPSHHVYLDGCAISGASSISTPLGDLLVDASLRMELMNEYKGEFEVMEKNVDEREHSGEMQYPFVQKVLLDAWGDNKNGNEVGTGHGSKNVISPTLRILPIMVGALSNSRENHYGKLMAPFLARRNVFTVISSDFCHWGKRFGYSPTTPPDHVKAPSSIKEIYQYIEWMDQLGMDNITSQEPGAFAKYIKLYKNTICGRHPIAVYLSAVKENKEAGLEEVDIRFVKYAQSSQVKSRRDSSVSYASAVIRKVV